ncbi:MAG: hypothetical protein HYW50_01890 [Candidatus Diapherotrites archaeon]|nr:hypothetical protein [Candidatus Diapherotrites archaeon]
MCIWTEGGVLPPGATFPTAQGIGGANSTFTWTPNFCQYKSNAYLFGAFIGVNCEDAIGVFSPDIFVSNSNRMPSLQSNPSGPINVNLGQQVNIGVSASDADTLQCTDAANKDVLILTKNGVGNFVDNGNGTGNFSWVANEPGVKPITFSVSDGRSGSANVQVEITVNFEPVLKPSAEPVPVEKNRYISFVPNNSGKMTALRVRMADLYDQTESPQRTSPGLMDLSAFEGEYRWVGPPAVYSENNVDPSQTFKGARLQCEPYFMNWGSVGLLHVFGEEIVPSSAYEVQAIEQACNPGVAECYSENLTVETAKWGDVVVPFGIVNFADISGVVDKFKGISTAPIMARADLYGGMPDNRVNFSDISKVVDAFKGIAYPFNITTSCN